VPTDAMAAALSDKACLAYDLTINMYGVVNPYRNKEVDRLFFALF
jgi:hypothetical protein